MLDQSLQLMYETMRQYPVACAHIEGASGIPNMTGDIYVYPFLKGSLVAVDVQGIPFSGFYGFHVHQHGPCTVGTGGYTGFDDVGGHYTTVENAPHPYHAGDLPVLMADSGHAFMIVYTERFVPEEILGRAMIIHEWPDDFRTQPTGDSGRHIGCGTFYPCLGYFYERTQGERRQETQPQPGGGTQPQPGTGMPAGSQPGALPGQHPKSPAAPQPGVPSTPQPGVPSTPQTGAPPVMQMAAKPGK